MTRWTKTNIDVGKVKENTKTEIIFQANEKLQIKNVKPGCGGCTTVKAITDNSIVITYKAGSIPKHLELQGTKDLLFTKSITVTYIDNSIDQLFFKGKIVK